jgi:radical SAM protein with 4Fe4S-binding SPASM domain
LKLTGGEPTLHPDFHLLFKHLDLLDIEFTLFTNARWARPKTVLDLMTCAHNLNGILVSLHGATPQAHDSFTAIPDSFAETVHNIRLAVARGVRVNISTVITAQNAHTVEDIAALAADLGADHIVFNRYLGKTQEGLTPAVAELLQAIETIEKLRRQDRPVKFGNCIPHCLVPNSSSGCLAGVAYCAVDPWGNLKPCTYSTQITGNLLHQPLEEAWRSPQMNAFRDAISPWCLTCQAFGTCHGGCKALAIDQGCAMDPLARPSSGVYAAPTACLSLHPDSRPLRRFSMRREAWGLVLLHGNRLMSVRSEAAPVLDALTGHTPLSEIQSRFGQAGLSLVGRLHQQGLVTLLQ